MANGPLGGNMGTPPVPPQPPQVSFETTAQSRGNFNNFLKSMPNTTSMTPIPPMGSSPMMPAPDPMASIDIFNQPVNMQLGGVAGNPLDSYGDYLSQQIDNTQVEPFIQEVQQMASQRFNLGGDSGGLKTFLEPTIFEPPQDLSRPKMEFAEPLLQPFNPMMQRPAAPFQMQGLGQPMRDKDGILREPMGLRGGPEMFNMIDQRIFNDGFMPEPAQLTGGFTRSYANGGDVGDFSDFGGFDDPSDPFGGDDNTDFSDPDSDMDYTDSYTDQDFTDATNIGSGGDNQPDAFPTSRPEILKEAIARAENEVFGGTASDALGFINKDGSLTNAGQKEYDSSIMANLDVLQDERPADTGTQLASIFDNKDILTASTKNVNPADIVQASFRPSSLNSTFSNNVLDGLDLNTAFGQNRNRNVEPEAFDMFGNPMSELTGQRGVSISNQAMQQKVDNDLADRAFSKGNFSMIGSADPDMDALERSIANTQRANEIQNQLANVNNQTLADRVQNQRGLGIDISTIPDISLENIMSSNISKEDPNKATVTQNISPQNTADRISRNNRTIDEIKADMGSRVPDTALETMAGRVGPTDTVFDIDTTDTRNFVGDDFDTALNLVDRNEADRLAAGQAMGVGTAPNLQNLTSTAMGRGQNVTRSIAPEDFEEKVGRDFNANRMADIERLYGEDVGQTKAGRGSDPTFFEDKGFTGTAGGILDAIERKTRENMANEIALGRPMGLGETFFGFNAPDLRTQTMKDYMSNVQPNYDFGDFNQTSKSIPEKQLVRNNSGRVIGIRDASGRLVSGMDPNAPMGSDDNNENPLILRPIAKPEEEKEEEDKPPNVIGGGDPITLPTPKSVVVDSPFTSNVSDFVPSTFNTGDINKLIEMLTGVAAPKSMKKGGVAGYAEGGRVMQALDNLLATA